MGSPAGMTEGGCPMAVIAASTLNLRPGAYEAFLEQHRKAKALLERSGARNVRLMGSIGGGAAGGALAVSFEFDDYASYGKFMDTLLADPEGIALLSSIGTADNPIVSTQQSVWSVIDA
jgi:hypothetical protein